MPGRAAAGAVPDGRPKAINATSPSSPRRTPRVTGLPPDRCRRAQNRRSGTASSLARQAQARQRSRSEARSTGTGGRRSAPPRIDHGGVAIPGSTCQRVAKPNGKVPRCMDFFATFDSTSGRSPPRSCEHRLVAGSPPTTARFHHRVLAPAAALWCSERRYWARDPIAALGFGLNACPGGTGGGRCPPDRKIASRFSAPPASDMEGRRRPSLSYLFVPHRPGISAHCSLARARRDRRDATHLSPITAVLVRRARSLKCRTTRSVCHYPPFAPAKATERASMQQAC